MNSHQQQGLVKAARAAIARGFLTAPGCTAYGAAVLTAGGATYQAGQYRSETSASGDVHGQLVHPDRNG